MKIARILGLDGDQSRGTGRLVQPLHPPSHRPLDLEALSLEPEAASITLQMSSTAVIDWSEERMSVVSFAYWEIGESDERPGMERPEIRGLHLMLAARTIETRTYRRGDRGHGCWTPLERLKKEER